MKKKCENLDCNQNIPKGREKYWHSHVICERCWYRCKYAPHRVEFKTKPGRKIK